MTQLGFQSVLVFIFSFSRWNSARAGICCYCVYLQSLLLFFHRSVMTSLHLFVPGFLSHIARIKMCYVHFRPLNVIMTLWSKKDTEMSELRRDALHLQFLIHGIIWESFFRGKKERKKINLKNIALKPQRTGLSMPSLWT